MRGAKKRSSVARLTALMRPHIGKIVFCVLSVVIVNLAELLKPLIMKVLIDDFLTKGTPQSGLYSITGMSIGYFIVIVGGSLFGLAQARLINRICQGILHGLRQNVFEHIHRMSVRYLDRYSGGRLITRATNDIETLNEFYSDVLVTLFRDVILLTGIVIVMVRMDPGLALVGFSTIPLIFLVTVLIRKKLRNNFVLMKQLIAQINGFFAENISGMRIIQAFNRQLDKLKEFRVLNQKYFKSTMIQVTMNSLLRPLMEVINSLTIALLVLYGYRGISGGLLELGVLYAFTTYIRQFFEPINDLAEKYNTIQSALVSADRIYELLDEKESQENLEAGKHRGPVEGSVEFRDVWFAYEEENWVLKGVSFKVEKGQKIAFVGATGSGKTTIINLISGFYPVNRGMILVDGVPVDDWALGDLRRGVAVVLQDVFLFSGSISENIRLLNDIDEEKTLEALKNAYADHFVLSLPGGLQAEVAERGSTLSSGERQLLSFARAIAHDPSILVLDEATANIDTQTEALIQQSIDSVSQGRTAIFIAHRLSTIRGCDMIYVIDAGRIIEQGDHEHLLALRGAYHRLYTVQLAQQEEALRRVAAN